MTTARVVPKEKQGTETEPTEGVRASEAAPVVLMMVGLPRSGKSTRARQIRDKTGALILNPDSFRIGTHGFPYIQRAERLIWANVYIAARSLLRANRFLILDATNTSKTRRDEWVAELRLEPDLSPAFYYLHIDTAKDICLVRAGGDDALCAAIERMARWCVPVSADEPWKPWTPTLETAYTVEARTRCERAVFGGAVLGEIPSEASTAKPVNGDATHTCAMHGVLVPGARPGDAPAGACTCQALMPYGARVSPQRVVIEVEPPRAAAAAPHSVVMPAPLAGPLRQEIPPWLWCLAALVPWHHTVFPGLTGEDQATAVLREAVELAVAAGLSDGAIHRAVNYQLAHRARDPEADSDSARVREAADVLMTVLVYLQRFQGWDPLMALLQRFEANLERDCSINQAHYDALKQNRQDEGV